MTIRLPMFDPKPLDYDIGLESAQSGCQFRAYCFGELRQPRISNMHHGIQRIDGRDFGLAIAGIADDNVAGQHGADFVFRLQGLVGQRRVARTQYPVSPSVDVELLL